MPLPVYAVAADWPEDVDLPENVDRLLVAASMLVRGATRTAIYRTTTDGLPTDTAVYDAFRDATIAQATTWATAGIDPDKPAAAPRVVRSKSLGSGAVTYEDAGQLVADQRTAASTLGAAAADILAAAGLLSGRPWVYG